MNTKELKEILENNNIVVLKCGAEWCSPCRTMEPIIESVAKIMEGKAKVIDIDVEESPDIATEYRVRNIPTILYFKDGELKDKSVGAMSEDELINRINNLM
jgi:thioredoxin 1